MTESSETPLTDELEDLNTQTVIMNRYCFWYHKRGNKQSVGAYEDSIKKITCFQTIEHFWRIYDHMVRTNDMKTTTDFHMFKNGIKPTWEDPQNEKGGKWMIRLKKGLSSRYWEELLIAIIGEQFDVGSEICGAVVSVRGAEDIISVWNKNADNTEAKNKIRDQMRRILRLPSYVQIEYKPHRDALTDGSSFRNTTVWKSTTNQRGTWTADGAPNGNSAGVSPRADGTGNTRSFNAPADGAGGNKFRQHTALPPGGDQAAWGQNRERPSWKPASTYSVSTSNNDSLSSGNPPISPIVSTLGGDSSSMAQTAIWGSKRDNNENVERPSGGWNRDRNVATAGASERDRSGDRERGNFYRDEDAAADNGFRSQTRNFRDSTARNDSNPTGTGNTYQRRRFDAAPTGVETEKKPRVPASNVSDQISVWGRGVKQAVVAEPPADSSS